MVKHAHAQEDKEARRDDILAAALALFLKDTRRLPTVAAIAAEAGLAKGTVYIYFESKEQVFASLLSREWDALLANVARSFSDAAEPREAQVTRFIDHFATFLGAHPYFMRLDALSYGHLEANLSPDDFWAFKEAFSSALWRTAKAVEKALGLSAGAGVPLLVRSYALTRGLWQTCDFADRWRSDARFKHHPLAGIDFNTELRAALYDYWHGGWQASRRNS